MRLRWVRILAKVTLILVLGLLLVEGSALGQDNQDREARIHQKMERLRALVQQRQQEGANLQPVGELMQGFPALMDQQKFVEAEALVDRALELINKLAPAAQAAGPPASLQGKMQCLQGQVQKWQQEGKNLQPIGEIMQDFQPLIEQQKFAEAERVIDRALKLVGEGCPDLPASAPAVVPPVSLQEKMQRLQSLVNQREQAGANLQPVGELMQGFEQLMQQKKFSEAEALVDRALKLLDESAQPNKSPESDEGNWIAFGGRDADGRQQIFVVKPDGTGKKRLTQEGRQNFFPAWSPDGKRLAFTSDRSGSLQIWVMEADGSNPKGLTTEGENVVPTWSPNGKRLAFGCKRSGHFEICAMDADGSRQKQLTKTDTAVGNNAAAWSPDGRRIAFSSTRSGHYAIWVMDPDGGHLTQLTTPYGDRYPDSNVPAWSPDGTKIAFWSGLEHRYGNVWVMDADGTNRKQLTDQPPGINCDEPAWSGDGSEIMFGSNRPGSEGIGNWIMNADGSNQRVLTTNVFMRGRPSWQPRPGPSVTVSSSIPAKNAANGFISLTLRDPTWRLQIFAIAPDGSRKQLTFEGDNGRPDWSPGGTEIAFASIRNGKSWVAVMAADGSNQKLLAEGKSPDWSPDGKQIAFSRSDGQITVMNADGTNIRQVTHSATFKSGPSWSPDGRQMVFILVKNPGSKTDPQPQIGIMNSDGTNERILTTEDRSNVCIGPDGRESFLATAHDANAPAWSPVDNRIAIWSGIERRYGQIWVINSDGTGSKQLTKECSRRNNDDPSWSSDGKKILFSTGRSGSNELWLMDADGSNEMRVSNIDAYPFPGRASLRPVP